MNERDIYKPELEHQLLIFMQECAKEFKKTGASEISVGYYSKSVAGLQSLVHNYLKAQIQPLREKKVEQKDYEFITGHSDLGKDTRVVLDKLVEERRTLAPVLDILKKADASLLTQLDFLNPLNTFLEVYTEGENQNVYYQNPSIQKLAVAFSEVDIEVLYDMLDRYSELFNHTELLNPPHMIRQEERDTLYQMIVDPLYRYEENITKYNTHPAFEVWGHYVLKSAAFEPLQAEEKKEFLYCLLKIYSPDHIDPKGYNPVLLETCCDLYTHSPELLEYRSLSIILSLLKTNEVKHNPELIEKLKPLIPLVPDLPSMEKMEEIKNMLKAQYIEGAGPKQIYEELLPVFETIVVKNKLEGTITSTYVEKKSKKNYRV